MQDMELMEDLSNSFSQTSFLEPLEPLSPVWNDIELELDAQLQKESDALSPPEFVPEKMPVNMVLQSVIDYPLVKVLPPCETLPTLNQLESQLDSQPELDHTDKVMRGGSRLKQIWENVQDPSCGGVFFNYNAKLVPWKKETLTRHEKLLEEQSVQEKRVELLQTKMNRLKKLQRNMTSTCQVHFDAIDDMKAIGENIDFTLLNYIREIKTLRNELKKQLRWAKEILNTTQKHLREFEIKDHTEDKLRARAKTLVNSMKDMISIVEDYETKDQESLPLKSDEFLKLRMEWCGVINEMKGLKLGLPPGTYNMAELSRKVWKKMEGIEKSEEIEKEKLVDMPKAKRRKLNAEYEKVL
jgi:hypothetical protein